MSRGCVVEFLVEDVSFVFVFLIDAGGSVVDGFGGRLAWVGFVAGFADMHGFEFADYGVRMSILVCSANDEVRTDSLCLFHRGVECWLLFERDAMSEKAVWFYFYVESGLVGFLLDSI